MSFFWIVFGLSAILFLFFTARTKPLYTVALAFLVFLVSFFPFIWGAGISMFDFFPPEMKFVGLKNLISAFTDPGLLLSAKITAIWTLTVVVTEIFISYALALMMLSLKRFSRIFYIIVMVPWAIPTYISVISWTALVEGYGGNSILSALMHTNFDLTTNVPAAFLWTAFVAAWLGIPMMTMVILSAMQTVPPHLEDLSRVEGMDPLEKTINVYIPHTFPVVFPYVFISFLAAFKEFSTVFLMTAGGPSTVAGFGQRTIVGSTTLLGMLMYDKFGTSQNYGVLGAYSVAIGSIMFALVMVGWNYRTKKNANRLILSVIAAHILFDIWGAGSGGWGSVPIAFYTVSFVFYQGRSKLFKRFFAIGALADATYLVFGIVSNGFDGVSLSAIVGITVALTLTFEGKIFVSLLKVPDLLWKALKILSMILWGTIVILPLWNVIVMAFSKDNAVPIEHLWPRGFTFGNFAALFENYGFSNALKNGVEISVFAVAVALLTIFPAAYAATHSKRSAKLGAVLLFASFFTGMHTLIPLALTFRFLDLMNNLFGISLVISVHGAVMAYFLIQSFLSGLPKNIDDAAKIDGAGGFTRMVKIALPLSVPILATVGVFVFIEGLNSFVLPLIFLSSQRLYPVSMVLYNLIGQYGISYSVWNVFGAGAIINILVIAIVFFIARKPIMNGIISKGGVED